MRRHESDENSNHFIKPNIETWGFTMLENNQLQQATSRSNFKTAGLSVLASAIMAAMAPSLVVAQELSET